MKWVPIGAGTFGILAWVGCLVFALLSGNISESGQFGDTFGVVNALFTMGAMIGASVAVYYQRAQLIDARHALEIDHRERIQEQHERQFFRLIELLSETARDIRTSGMPPEHMDYYSGMRAFQLMAELNRSPGPLEPDFQKRLPRFGRWLRTAEMLMDFIQRMPDGEQREFFGDVFRAQFGGDQRKFISVTSNLYSEYASIRPKLDTLGIFDGTP